MADPLFMVLGGGSAQLPLIHRLKSSGIPILLCDRDPDAPGRALADRFVPVSTFDVTGVVEAARKEGVTAVATMGTDQPVLAAAAAAEALGLPSFLTRQQALGVTDKQVMKRLLHEAGIPAPRFRIIDRDSTTEELAGLQPPLVVKPLDSQGQRGVLKVATPVEALERAEEVLIHSRQKEYLVEEYYAATEITVSGWCRQGKAVVFSITDRVTMEAGEHIGICLAHRFPSRHLGRHGGAILALTRRIVEAFGIQEGPLYFQILIGAKGLLVNEIACRLGGAYEDEFIPLITGVDTVDLLIRGALGEELPQGLPSFTGLNRLPYLSVPLLFCRPGTIAAYKGCETIRDMGGVTGVKILQPPGTMIRPLDSSGQRALSFVVKGGTASEVNRTLDKIHKVLQVKDDQGEDLLIPWVEFARHSR